MAGDQPNWNMSMGEKSPAYARMAELADAADLKSAGREVVRVRVPLCAPYSKRNLKIFQNIAIINYKVKRGK